MSRRDTSMAVMFVLALLAAAAGCLYGVPGITPPAVYPRIVPVPGGAMPNPPVYRFPFGNGTVWVNISVQPPVYAGARAADKSVRISDQHMKEEDWKAGIYQAMVADPAQDSFYSSLAGAMRKVRDEKKLEPDAYAELMAVFVQSIPYEHQNLSTPRFPVETYVDGKGDCDDKSLLLAGLLSREDYRAALLYFEPEHHMAAGVGCQGPGYRGTGYAYIETTNVSLVGIVPVELEGGARLDSDPMVIPVGSGSRNYTRCNETGQIWQEVLDTASRLESLEASLQALEQELDGRRAVLEGQKQVLDAARANGDLERYNAGVGAYNEGVVAYNQRLSEYRDLADQHNQLAAVHNYLVSHQFDRQGSYAWLMSLSDA